MEGTSPCFPNSFLTITSTKTMKPDKCSKTMKPEERSNPDWTGLPDLVLPQIALCLNSRHDTYIFRAVCKTFLKAVPRPTKILFPDPSLIIPAPIDTDITNRGHFSVTASTVYSIEPRTSRLGNAQPWLVKVQELENGKVLVKDFLSRYYFKNLPTNHLPEHLYLMDFKVKELTKAYELQLNVYDEKYYKMKVEFESTKTFLLQKVIITLASDVAEVGFAVMAIHDGGKVHVWRQGDGKWNNISFEDNYSFDDMLYYKKKFYVLDHTGHLIAVDPKTLHIVQVAGRLPNMGMGFRYLLESCGQLFMVIKYWSSNYPRIRRNYEGTQYPVHLEVYKLDKESRKWIEVMDELKDRVAFVGDDCSFSVPARDLPGCEGNYVLLADISFSEEANDHPGWHVGVYNLTNGTAVPIRSFPKYPNMFWPPPCWLRQEESTSAGF